MASTVIGSCVRIGLIGLGPFGTHHLERISLRNDLKVTAACDAGVTATDRVPRFSGDWYPAVADLPAGTIWTASSSRLRNPSEQNWSCGPSQPERTWRSSR